MPLPDDVSRRAFLEASAASLALTQTEAGAGQQPEAPRPGPRTQPPARQGTPKRRIAVVTTAYHYLSHAYHIVGRFAHGYLRDGRPHFPDYAVAGMHVDQPKHAGDLSHELSKEFGFTL